MKLLTFLAGRYVAGDTWHDALVVVRKMNAHGLAVTLDFLGESVTKRKKAFKALHTYLHLLDSIASHGLKAHVSIKLSQLGLHIGEDFCRDNVEQLLHEAQRTNGFVWLDMENSSTTRQTIDLYKFFIHKYPHQIGICLQALLRRTQADVRELLPLHPVIRLVKGAYKEKANISFERKKDTDANYRELLKVILAEQVPMLAVATHDESIIHDAKILMKKTHSPTKVEFQMLYGIKRQLQEKLVREGYAVRIYVPFGGEWLPYFLRRLKERKENLFFAFKSLFQP